MVEVLTFHDRPTFSLAGSTDDWLAHDHDVAAPVFLFAYPSHTSIDPHRSRWSIAWPVGGPTLAQMVAWRHVHADAYDNEAGLETDPPRYVYAGAITKTAGPGTVLAKRFLLDHLDLSMRKRIEELAAETPLSLLEGESSANDTDGQGWIKALLDRMVSSAIIPSTTRDRVVEQASSGTLSALL